jgi:hypothetical protein
MLMKIYIFWGHQDNAQTSAYFLILKASFRKYSCGFRKQAGLTINLNLNGFPHI